MKNNKKKGFTIVELVIVIAVIGILSAILIPTFVGVTKAAEEAALNSNLANAYSMYMADAADGVKDNSEPAVYFIKILDRSELVFVKGSDNYHFNSTDNKWEKFTPAGTLYNVGSSTSATYTAATNDVKYGDFVVKTTNDFTA